MHMYVNNDKEGKQKLIIICEIWASHIGDRDDSDLAGCDVVSRDIKFQSNPLFPLHCVAVQCTVILN